MYFKTVDLRIFWSKKNLQFNLVCFCKKCTFTCVGVTEWHQTREFVTWNLSLLHLKINFSKSLIRRFHHFVKQTLCTLLHLQLSCYFEKSYVRITCCNLIMSKVSKRLILQVWQCYQLLISTFLDTNGYYVNEIRFQHFDLKSTPVLSVIKSVFP